MSRTAATTATAAERITRRIEELDDWRGELLKRLRGIILKAAPGISEAWKWNTPAWEKDGLICAAGAFNDHVKLNFFKGAALKDPKHIFNSGLDAMTTRAVDFFKGDKVDEAALTALVREAVALNRAQ